MSCRFIFAGLLIFISLAGNAQTVATGNYDFIPRSNIIFEDDLQSDTVNKFPAQWHFPVCNIEAAAVLKSYCTIKNDVDGKVFVIDRIKDKKDTSLSTLMYIAPVLNSPYLPDSFTIESDFLLPSSMSSLSFTLHIPAIKTAAYLNGFGFGGHFAREDGRIFYSYVYGGANSIHGLFPNVFDHSKWHHLAISANKNRVNVYIDQYKLCDISDFPKYPKQFSWLSTGGIKYRNFKIAGGKENNELNAIITKNKLVSHAINFDLNQSVIRQESVSFIMELAQLLKTNPSVRLEIDGHTDSNGTAESNRKLSQARADEVKKELVTLGIDATRLTTKGYGATRPLQPNTTDKGRAENRRVEFIRQ